MPATTALTGFSYVHIAKLLKNTAEEYEADTAKRYFGAAGLSGSTSNATESSIAADDDPNWLVYREAGRSQGERRTLTMREMLLEHVAELTAADYDAATKTLSYNPDSGKTVPQIAISFASLQANGEYRMEKYYACDINSAEYADRATASGSAQAADFSVDFTAARPLLEGTLIKRIRDGNLDLNWLKDFTDFMAPTTP